MRILLVLLIFAIGFSGFSAAAHAFDSQNCHEATSAGEKEAGALHDCPEHAEAQSQTADSNSQDNSHICLNCDHCCVSYLGFPQFSSTSDTPDRSETFEPVDAAMADSAVSKLKRPPKYLV
ncbi:MAG: hypothetical protein Q8K65_01750 [Alphaproteobacteria bacterium]|nr:hypothetical protein [Alphaproteobacteria bacterium]